MPEVDQEQPAETDGAQEVEIERLPDTGGPSLPTVPVTELIAVTLLAFLIHGGFKRIRG